jgi:hypothetical protein
MDKFTETVDRANHVATGVALHNFMATMGDSPLRERDSLHGR